MDPLCSPSAVSTNGTPRTSVVNTSSTTSVVASPARPKLSRSVKFDPTIGGDVGGLLHSSDLSLDTSFVRGAGDDADAREHYGGRGRGDEAVNGSPLYSCDVLHDHEELLPFQLTREDVAAAFEFLDVNGSGLLTMGNLKHRLSAFYPHLTSKEYKFLVEDPSGSTGGGGAASSAARSGAAARHGGAADGCGSSTRGPTTSSLALAASSARPSNLSVDEGGDTAHIDGALPGEGVASGAGGSHTAGARAGLDVDQLWDLINSFQQLQRTFGAAQAGQAEGQNAQNTRSAFNASFDAYLVSAHGNQGIRSADIGFDAVGEAFRIYDPHNTHYVEEEVLSCIMARVGFGELTEEELAVLVSTADFDGDGRISLEDFRRLVSMKGRFKK
ncbi:EF-hand domain pair [Leishmania donovani]|nr:EF-hand domain pair [Leishmania donovani]